MKKMKKRFLTYPKTEKQFMHAENTCLKTGFQTIQFPLPLSIFYIFLNYFILNLFSSSSGVTARRLVSRVGPAVACWTGEQAGVGSWVRIGSPFSSIIVVLGHRLVTLPLTVVETLTRTAAHPLVTIAESSRW